MQNQYSRTQLLLGAEAMEKLHNSRVAVISGVMCTVMYFTRFLAFQALWEVQSGLC